MTICTASGFFMYSNTSKTVCDNYNAFDYSCKVCMCKTCKSFRKCESGLECTKMC